MTTLTAAKQRNAGASPALAVMAWLTATGAPRVRICSSASDMPRIDGMAWMYLLMCLVHLPPWLKPASGRPRQVTHATLHT
jgi:hypothetical protein